MSNYKKLDVWLFSMEVVKEIYKITKTYPPGERYGLISQTNRAAVSIPANISEGFGRSHTGDTLHFLHISRGSAYELETLLSVSFMINIIDEESFNKLNKLLEKNLKVLNGYINYLDKK